jgi:methylated-DNA-[protein]-cysteine S-methyltransferase
MYYSLFDTALGTCGIMFRSVDDGSIVHIFLPSSEKDILTRIRKLHPESIEGHSPRIQRLVDAIVRYLNGGNVQLPMDLLDTSVCYPFQRNVLMTERTIPRGMVASYGWVAGQVGTKGVRAVGNALARNPFPLVIPCHRAVRSDRTLGGFQGGLEMKRALLEMEGVEFDAKFRVASEYMMTAESTHKTVDTNQYVGSSIWLI